jgi:hypothetical protein
MSKDYYENEWEARFDEHERDTYIKELEAKNKELLEQRDEARRAFCNAEFRRTGKPPEEVAEIFRWKCF